jgi:hypothetical protein
MKKLTYILLLWITTTNVVNAQLLKFSTFYASFSTSAPFAENQAFLVNGVAGSGQLVETTQVSQPNRNVSVGLRKIARFDYQVKQGQFYTGNENEVSDYATVSNAPGIEYLLEYSSVRNRGVVFEQHEYKVRYISNHFTSRAAYVDDGLIDLKYTLGEVRLRKSLGGLDLTAGVAHRSHPVYGYSPIQAWFSIPENKHWWQLANEFGFYSDENECWTRDGVCVSMSDVEFYRYHFTDAVSEYNKREINKLGLQQELSCVIGADYYYYQDRLWLHSWASIYPLHKGLSDYSYEYPGDKIEYDLGLIFGFKFNRHFSIFVEGRKLKYWDIESYEMRTGINYIIF